MNDKSITKVITKVAVVLIVFILSAVLITTLILDNIMPETGFEVDNKLKITRLAITIVGSLPFAIGSFFLVDKLQAKKERERLEEEIYGIGEQNPAQGVVGNNPIGQNWGPVNETNQSPNPYFDPNAPINYEEAGMSEEEPIDHGIEYPDPYQEGYEGQYNEQNDYEAENSGYYGGINKEGINVQENYNQPQQDIPPMEDFVNPNPNVNMEDFINPDVEEKTTTDLPEYTVDEFISNKELVPPKGELDMGEQQNLNGNYNAANEYDDKISKLEEEIRKLTRETQKQQEAIQTLTSRGPEEVNQGDIGFKEDEWDLDSIAEEVNLKDQYLKSYPENKAYLTPEEREYLTRDTNPVEDALKSYNNEYEVEDLNKVQPEYRVNPPEIDTEVDINIKEDFSDNEMKDDLSEIERLLRGES